VPIKIWPLWTGMATLIEKPLTDADVEEYTRIAGRRPFLWVNRTGPDMEKAFAIDACRHDMVFNGDFLPHDLNRLFEGIHFNLAMSPKYQVLPDKFSRESLVYLATGADYIWNPDGWTPAGSLERARKFVDIMLPLIGDTVFTGKEK
jgi:hypothetical protein